MEKLFAIIVLVVFLVLSLIVYFVLPKKNFEDMDKKIFHKKISACKILAVAIIALSVVAIIVVIIHNNNLYRVLDVYDTGAGVRCLTDADHETTALPFKKDKADKINELDLIDSDGNVIVSGIWFGAEVPDTSETNAD